MKNKNYIKKIIIKNYYKKLMVKMGMRLKKKFFFTWYILIINKKIIVVKWEKKKNPETSFLSTTNLDKTYMWKIGTT